MDVKNWANIIEQLRPHIKALRITGGEPTLHKQFGDMMEMVNDLGVPIVLFSNGNWANSQVIIQILKRCTYLQGVLVSLHGADAASYQQFTGVDAFASVANNIRLAADAGLRMATNTLLLTTTFERIKEIANFVLSWGVSTASFGRHYGEPLPGLSLTPEQLQSALTQIARLHWEEPRIVLSNCIPVCFIPDLEVVERGCTSGFTHCTIGPEGDVRPCTHTPLTLGYIQDSDIETLWQSPRLDGWRRRIPAPCYSCAALSYCRGGCRALAQQLDLPCDPLMVTPLSEPKSMPIIELAAQDRPMLTCSVESMPYGYALTGAGYFVTLSSHSGPILQALDGQYTVQQLQEKYGLAGLQLVGSLFEKRLVVME
jgi:radical SAM protein with 4Fe4S-binding SPASM domain